MLATLIVSLLLVILRALNMLQLLIFGWYIDHIDSLINSYTMHFSGDIVDTVMYFYLFFKKFLIITN